ncbi:MAG: orotate phosphoribosyltransferase [Oligoflexia bacterium]|nr:orotate phosphoribosyltransferase [Oligoflexia bacterium]
MTASPPLTDNQCQFVDFMIESQALLFGDFKLKSGRQAPYFINTGKFNDAKKIQALGQFYARHIEHTLKSDFDLVFGPAYKGIPLAVSVAQALWVLFGKNKGFSFDRKEEKDHGDGGKIVGYPIKPGARVLLVEDVITAGTTLRQTVPYLVGELGAKLTGVVIAVDRCERGTGALSALDEARTTLNIDIFPIVNVHQIVSYLSTNNTSGFVLDDDLHGRISNYLEHYGV